MCEREREREGEKERERKRERERGREGVCKEREICTSLHTTHKENPHHNPHHTNMLQQQQNNTNKTTPTNIPRCCNRCVCAAFVITPASNIIFNSCRRVCCGMPACVYAVANPLHMASKAARAGCHSFTRYVRLVRISEVLCVGVYMCVVRMSDVHSFPKQAHTCHKQAQGVNITLVYVHHPGVCTSTGVYITLVCVHHPGTTCTSPWYHMYITTHLLQVSAHVHTL